MIHFAEPPLFNGTTDGLHRRVEPVLMVGADLDAGLFGFGQDQVGVRQRQGDRFFDDDVAAGADAVDRKRRVRAAHRSNGNKLRLFGAEHFTVIGVFFCCAKLRKLLL